MTDTLWPFLAAALQSDFFAGGLALGALGVLATLAHALWRQGGRALARRLRASVTIDNRSESYRHFLLWLGQSGVLRHVRQLYRTDPRHSDGTAGFAPAPGRHWFWYQGRPCCFEWSIDEKRRVGPGHSQRMMETLTVTIFLGRTGTIMGWLARGAELARARDRIGPGLHVLRGDYWDHVGDVPGRGIDSVVVDDDRIDRVLADMRWFYGARDWYAQRGVPWRRGYLFHGPPGTGKSSLARALATELQLDIATMDIGRVGLTDDDLREAMMSAPERTVLVIEDVDAVFVQRTGEARVGVSFSGLLNAIDGVGAQEGRALILTTNHIQRLDPALIRPGRADMHVELGLVGSASAGRLFERFFPGQDMLRDRFCTALGPRKVAPSALQGWLLETARDPERAATAAGLLAQEQPVAAE